MSQTSWEIDALFSAELDRAASCHYGDHNYNGAVCADCGHFNAALLAWMAQEKAERDGRHHGDHWHRTAARAAACQRPTHDEGPCADRGGCLHHEPSESFVPPEYADAS